ncbi:MAG TPA: hypothetical protein DDW50_14040 [Firmicutes bacterium]|nr:hypothetical protein [Bacillota bacterium]
MLYVPFENFEIESTLSPDEVKERIANHIETNMPLFKLFYSGGKEFKGKIRDDHFLISRIIRYNNSFLPMIEGTIYPNNFGSNIKITMRLHKLVFGFWIVWMAMVFLISLGFLRNLLSSPGTISLIPLLMLIFGYFIGIIPFNIEVNKAKRLLQEIMIH